MREGTPEHQFLDMRTSYRYWNADIEGSADPKVSCRDSAKLAWREREMVAHDILDGRFLRLEVLQKVLLPSLPVQTHQHVIIALLNTCPVGRLYHGVRCWLHEVDATVWSLEGVLGQQDPGPDNLHQPLSTRWFRPRVSLSLFFLRDYLQSSDLATKSLEDLKKVNKPGHALLRQGLVACRLPRVQSSF